MTLGKDSSLAWIPLYKVFGDSRGSHMKSDECVTAHENYQCENKKRGVTTKWAPLTLDTQPITKHICNVSQSGVFEKKEWDVGINETISLFL